MVLLSGSLHVRGMCFKHCLSKAAASTSLQSGGQLEGRGFVEPEALKRVSNKTFSEHRNEKTGDFKL